MKRVFLSAVAAVFAVSGVVASQTAKVAVKAAPTLYYDNGVDGCQTVSCNVNTVGPDCATQPGIFYEQPGCEDQADLPTGNLRFIEPE
jgi:hypothetical protein